MKVVLLDGGVGQELVHRAGDHPTPLWSTQVMIDHPELVGDVHRDFFDAGATVATANTYAAFRAHLSSAGIEDQFEQVQNAALDHARRAAEGRGRIAGSLGPLDASYRPETHPVRKEAVRQYDEAASLMAPHVDILLCETVASLDHARDVLEGAAAAGRPVWISFTIDDEDGSVLRSGEGVAEAVECAVAGGAEAILANCSAPEAMVAALDLFRSSGLPYGAYANAFTQITKEFLLDGATSDVLTARPELVPTRYADFAMRWVDHGATIVGGCCETTPVHIAEIARRLEAAGHEIV